jgi:hypothetical protein
VTYGTVLHKCDICFNNGVTEGDLMASTFRHRLLVVVIAAGLGASLLAAAAPRAVAAPRAAAAAVKATEQTAAGAPATDVISVPNLSETAQIGTAVSVTVNATSSTAATLDFAVAGLPSGLSYAQTGPEQITISGTPDSAAAGLTRTTITAADPLGGSATGYISWTLHGIITIAPLPDRTSTVGDNVQLQLSASDSVPNPTAALSPATVTGLPAGMSSSTSWAFPNTSTASTYSGNLYKMVLNTAGIYHVTVTFSDSLGATATQTFTWTVKPVSSNSGWTGAIRLNLGGKCLDGNGTKVQIWTCNGGSTQIWTVAKDWTVHIHGQCLTETETTNRSRVVLAACNGSKAQQWELQPEPLYGHPALTNAASGKCLDDTAQSTVNGTAQEIWSCTGGSNQTWTPPAAPIQSMIPGMCLADPANATTNGTRVVLWQCNGWKEENWTFAPDRTIRIHGKCLADAGNSTSDGAAVVLETCNGSKSERWYFYVFSPGLPVDEMLYNDQNPRPIGVNANSAANGTPLVFHLVGQPDGMIWLPPV